jgi:hypothetical protein
MAATGKWYGKAFVSAFNKEMDIDTDTIKVMLCTSTYTPDQDTHQYKSSVTNELVGTGYTATGVTLASPVVTYTGATNVFKFTGANATWTGLTAAALRYAVVYDSTPATDATRPLICYIDFGADQAFTGDFTLTWDSAGIVTCTVA